MIMLVCDTAHLVVVLTLGHTLVMASDIGWICIASTLLVHQKQVWKGLTETCDFANVYLVKNK